ncbi:hypothetical protein [Mesorhizobium marinum]|uniref:XRE family transcriptional regulator n=1 Tax=Mesorhizobium marinum TaxID=3228790 RepID=A0ABV3R321_9HYPH
MSTRQEPMDFVAVLETLRQRIAECGRITDLARKLDVDYQRLTYFVRNPKSAPAPETTAKLMAFYGFKVVAEREAA